MRSPNRSVMLGAAVGLGLFATGCGETQHRQSSTNSNGVQIQGIERGPALGKPYPGILRCVAQTPEAWQPTPDDLKAAAMARDIGGVSPDQVLEGRWGPATCDEAITASQADSRADVQSIGAKCLVIGVDTGPSPTPPTAHQTFHKVLAVCAMAAI